MTHLVDTSVWGKYLKFEGITRVIDGLANQGILLTTCPPVAAEYCYTAQNPGQLMAMQTEIAKFFTFESRNLSERVAAIQTSMWRHGFVRGAGAIDALIGAYALEYDQTVVTCDRGFINIATALKKARSRQRLRVDYVSENGEVEEIR